MIETATLIAAIVGLVEVVKRAFDMNSRFAPLLAVALGVLALVAFQGFSPVSVFEGVIAGLGASGLYSGVKATAGL